ncbi:MAG: protein kinase domain-containing protein [Bryobacteraceae bacterium]
MKQVGRYQIVEELGRGAMGIVYKALDPAIGRTIAIKTIRLSEFSDPDERQRIRERLLREAQSAGLLSHPNIVTIYDVLEEGDYAHIFMEYVRGSSLEKMLRGQSLPEPSALPHFLRQVSNALDYAHREGVVHRDIKPANIMISEAGTKMEQSAKIADFGVAKFVSQEMTQGGTMIGTPNYMSPEQIQGTTVDGRSDQFSLAVVVYEILSRAKPFAAENVPALLYLICKQDPQPIQQVNPKLNEGVGGVLQRALAKDPEERFVSCGEFIGALATALESSPQWATIRGPGMANARSMLNETTERSVPLVAAETSAMFQNPNLKFGDSSGAGISPPIPYELPKMQRRRRGLGGEDADETPQRSSFWTKLGLLLAICLLLLGAAVFFRRWIPALNLPVQVLDTKSGPVTPAPAETNTASKEKANQEQKDTVSTPNDSAKLEQQNTETAQSEPARQGQGNTETPRNEPANQKQENTGVRRNEPPTQMPQASSEDSPRSSVPGRQMEAEQSGGVMIADVELLSEPPGARIVVDNRLRDACTSPCTLSLQNGRHTMLAQLTGYTDALRIFTVPEDNSVFLTLNKSMGVLIVTSSPPGASVFVDGKNYGHTPSTLHLPAGRHLLALVNGPLRHEETIEIQNDGLASRDFRFAEQ